MRQTLSVTLFAMLLLAGCGAAPAQSSLSQTKPAAVSAQDQSPAPGHFPNHYDRETLQKIYRGELVQTYGSYFSGTIPCRSQ